MERMRALQMTLCATIVLATIAAAQRGGGGDRGTPAPSAPPPSPPPERPAPTTPRPESPSGPRTAPSTPEDPAERPLVYFRTCDYDGNGWISFSEAKASMNLDRTAFGVYDTDNDGRITQDEYVGRYQTIVSRGGAFAPPVDKVVARKLPSRTSEDLLAAFDVNHDGALDQRDVQRALAEYGAQGVDGARVLATVDHDGSGLVEGPEMQALLDVLVPPALSVSRRKVASVEELFDRTEARKITPDSTPEPDRILGPVNTFRRLDFDASGGISISDLDSLQRPLQIPIRTGAVVATLDSDGDGAISPEELAQSMR